MLDVNRVMWYIYNNTSEIYHILRGAFMKNKLGFLGLLGFAGLLGFTEGNAAFYGFFGFFIYFTYFKVIPDELFQANVGKAASISFFVALVSMAAFLLLTVLLKQALFMAWGLGLSFALSVFTFTVLLTAFELKEKRGAR